MGERTGEEEGRDNLLELEHRPTDNFSQKVYGQTISPTNRICADLDLQHYFDIVPDMNACESSRKIGFPDRGTLFSPHTHEDNTHRSHSGSDTPGGEDETRKE